MAKTQAPEVKTPRRPTTRPQDRVELAPEGFTPRVITEGPVTGVQITPDQVLTDGIAILDGRRVEVSRGQVQQRDPAMQPFLNAATSHLDRPLNPKPEWPETKGLYGTGAISLLARLDDAMERRNRATALGVDTLRAPAEVGVYKQAVLAWLDAEGVQ